MKDFMKKFLKYFESTYVISVIEYVFLSFLLYSAPHVSGFLYFLVFCIIYAVCLYKFILSFAIIILVIADSKDSIFSYIPKESFLDNFNTKETPYIRTDSQRILSSIMSVILVHSPYEG